VLAGIDNVCAAQFGKLLRYCGLISLDQHLQFIYAFLAISQPVVSKVIADLEHVLGVRLLVRDRHGAEPTIYGAALLKHGVAVFDELKQSVQEIEFLADPSAGELRIGTSGAMVAGILPVILNRLRRRNPRLTFNVTQATSESALFRGLRGREIDLILARMTTPVDEDDLSADVLFGETLLVVAGIKNRWVRRRCIELLVKEVMPAVKDPVEKLGWYPGDIIRRVTRFFGAKYCQACDQRRRRINAWFGGYDD
jgi:hypothetical protein